MENTQLTAPPPDLSTDRARELHKKAQSTGIEFLNTANELGAMLSYIQSDPQYDRKFRQYCKDADIPKSTAYRYIQIFNHAKQIRAYIDDGDTVVNALKKALKATKKESVKEIDITPRVKVIDIPSPADDDAILFNGDNYPNQSYTEPKKDDPNKEKNNYRARLATMKKNKSGSQADIDRRNGELDLFISQAEIRITKRNESNKKDEAKIKDYNNEKELISGYRVK